MPLSSKQIATLAVRDSRVAKALVGRAAGASFSQLAARTKLDANQLRGSRQRLIAKGTIKMVGNGRAARYYDKAIKLEKKVAVKSRPVAKRAAGKIAHAQKQGTIKTRRSGGMKKKKRTAKK